MASAPATAVASAPAATPAVRRLGRYELRRLLGKSLGTMTWLAADVANGVEVMLTLPRVQPPDPPALAAWMQTAGTAARLDHPQLAPVLDLGVHERWPYVVNARGTAITLAERLAENPVVLPMDAAKWLADVLQGLAYAHEANSSHGDLQPHGILLTDDGRARVMALAAASTPAAAGTGGAESSSAVAVAAADDTYGSLRSHRLAAERDVVACALLLHRLLAGRAPFALDDTSLALAQLTPQGRMALRLPWQATHAVPAALRAIVDRGTAWQPRHRYLDARPFLRALEGWLHAERADGGGPVALLFDRLHTVGHLPASRGTAEVLRELGTLDGQRTDVIAEHLLGDLALSIDLLRQVNAAQSQNPRIAGDASVLTLRRCVAMLGMDSVRRTATALRPWPGPLSDEGAAALQRCMAQVRVAGRLALALRPVGYDTEVVCVVTALQNLGRLLAHYHFQDEAAQMAQLMADDGDAAAAHATAPRPSSAEAAAFAVLGVGLDDLGVAVARRWGFGEDVLHMMRRLPSTSPVRTPHDDLGALRTLASAANEAVDATQALPPSAWTVALLPVAKRHAAWLGLSPQELCEALLAAQQAPAAAQAGSTPAVAAAQETVAAPRRWQPRAERRKA